MTSSSTEDETLQVGCLILSSGPQLLDVSPVDLFGMLDRIYLTECQLPAHLVAHGIKVKINYISDDPSTRIAECTAEAGLRITAHIDEKNVQPGVLDVLMIPGPSPTATFSDAVLRFIREHVESKTAVMSVCTGVFPLGASGALKGRMATAPRALLPQAEKNYPDTKWIDKRWVNDGNVWSSGGITNGQDMVAAYLRGRYPGVLSDTVCALADVGDRQSDYGSGKASSNMWWLILILKAWFVRPRK